MKIYSYIIEYFLSRQDLLNRENKQTITIKAENKPSALYELRSTVTGGSAIITSVKRN